MSGANSPTTIIAGELNAGMDRHRRTMHVREMVAVAVKDMLYWGAFDAAPIPE
jgi:hypothetical protein